MKNPHAINEPGRREFIKRCAGAAVGAVAVSGGLTLGLPPANAALTAAPTAFTDYRALVCVFLRGGNDAFNMVVPTSDPEYTPYAAARGALAVDRSTLLSLTPDSPPAGGGTYGFHESCSDLAGLFSTGQLAIVANCGTLVEPTTATDLAAGTVALPGSLYSHRHQFDLWQSIDGASTGWAGRAAVPIRSGVLGMDSTAQNAPVNISLAGYNLLQQDPSQTPLHIDPRGVMELTGLDGSNTARLAAYNDLLTAAQTGTLLQQAYGATMERARDTSSTIAQAVSALAPLNTQLPDSELGRQLTMVTHLVRVLSSAAFGSPLSSRRNVFFVSIGGWDTHSDQASRHAALLSELNASLDAFYLATVEMGLQDNVVTFTNSEFGRTLTTNGAGTDNGWGGHSLVMGGCVVGRQFYGAMPSLALGGPDDDGGGRIIPTTPVDSVGATIARWFGITGLPSGGTVAGGSDMDNAFPNLVAGAFPGPHDLGFML